MENKSTSATITPRKTERDFTHNGQTVLSLEIRYPHAQLASDRLAQMRINGRIWAQVADYTRYAATTLQAQAIRDYKAAQANDYPFRMHGAGLTYEVTYNRNCHLSMYRDEYQYTGGAHGLTFRYSDTWNLRGGARVQLGSFFRPGTDWRRLLIKQILRQAEMNMRKDPGIYFEDYRTLIVKYFDPESFYLTPAGIVIYYQQYEIAPYAVGIVEFTIPYALVHKPPSCAR